MLTVTIPGCEIYYPDTNEFSEIKAQTITLEHSLIAISKWESKWKKAFIGPDKKTDEEVRDYIRCMTITKNVDERIYCFIPGSIISQITKYIEDPMTATTFRDLPNKKNKSKSTKTQKKTTSEEIYWQMTVLNIPFECEKWNFNRLSTLIKVCNIRNNPSKKMNKKEILSSNKELNEARRAAMNTKG